MEARDESRNISMSLRSETAGQEDNIGQQGYACVSEVQENALHRRGVRGLEEGEREPQYTLTQHGAAVVKIKILKRCESK